MTGRAEKAVDNHKNFYSCSAAVLCAFTDEAGMTEQEAKIVAAPFAGGKMGKCGAVLAAEYVLAKKYGKDSEQIAKFEKSFTDMNKSLMCREIRQKKLRSCRGCVTDAASLLEKMISI